MVMWLADLSGMNVEGSGSSAHGLKPPTGSNE